MPCYKPVKAFYGSRLPSGKREIVFSSGQAQSCLDLKLPCGSCVGCRLERARQWAMRCVDEASMHKENSFITLTFNDDNLPLNRSLDVSIFQKFMKRLRKEVAPLRLRFFIVENTALNWAVRIIIRLFSDMDSLTKCSSKRRSLVRRFICQSSWIVYGALDILLSVTLRLAQRHMSHAITSRKLGPWCRTITMSIVGRESYSLQSISR